MTSSDEIRRAQVEAGENKVIEGLKEKGLIKDQPAPQKNTNFPIQDLVIQDIEERKRLGLERYGTLLQANNGRDALVDAYQEALDMAIYIRQRIEEDRCYRFGVIKHPLIEGEPWVACAFDKGHEGSCSWEFLGNVLEAFAKAKIDRQILLRERDGEVWIWQGDEEDHPESLTCPILIHPQDLLDILNEKEALSLLADNVRSIANEAGRTEGMLLKDFFANRLLEPIPMILSCPACGKQHIDKPEAQAEYDQRFQEHMKTCERDCIQEFPCPDFKTRWFNPPHKSHKCRFCGVIWRPAAVPTVGVESIEAGKEDTWSGIFLSNLKMILEERGIKITQ